MKKNTFLIALSVVAFAFTSCKKKEGCTDATACNYDSEAEKDDGSCEYCDENAALKEEIKETYASIVYASYEDAFNEAVELQSAINDFVANPTQAGLDACKQAWKDAREPYGQTEAYRFANGPIDDEDGPEGLLNAWPLDEGYIDYVSGSPNSGIVNDTTTTIDAATLEGLNEQGGEKNISIGYHAIEFLLWGQDDADVTLQTPGNRPYTDYLVSGGTASNQARRGLYLQVCADLLVSHLLLMKNEWDPNGSSNYRTTFMAQDSDAALKNILTALGTLSKSELAGERMFVALDNQDQEDEHSCFSDNTHRDVILNAQGIRNVYTGSYTRVDGSSVSGSSIEDLIAKVDASLGSELSTLSSTSITNVNAIPTPFDYALTQETAGGAGPIMTAINTLQDQGDKIVEVGTKLGITISAELPD